MSTDMTKQTGHSRPDAATLAGIPELSSEPQKPVEPTLIVTKRSTLTTSVVLPTQTSNDDDDDDEFDLDERMPPTQVPPPDED